jgi:CHAD domain-containing protein
MTAVIDAARGLQEILGSYQDAVTAEERLRATAISAGNVSAALVAGSLIERQRQTRAKLTKDLPAAWKQLRQTTRRRRR